jgi:hypothetical protein
MLEDAPNNMVVNYTQHTTPPQLMVPVKKTVNPQAASVAAKKHTSKATGET